MPVMKPDIVFFGEGLPREFHESMNNDKSECDLLIVMGSSLKVRPVALIPSAIPPNVPQILINREPLNHLNFDVELLGDCDEIIKVLCSRLGGDWTEACFGKSDSNPSTSGMFTLDKFISSFIILTLFFVTFYRNFKTMCKCLRLPSAITLCFSRSRIELCRF